MKIILLFIILLFIILSQISLFSKWEEIKSPQSIQILANITSGSNFLVGSRFNPYFSFDGGETWEKRTNGLPDERGGIDKIIVKKDLILISTLITNSIRSQHILYSTDQGKNWKKIIDGLHSDSRNTIFDFTADNNNVYLLSTEDAILKTNNFGVDWDTLPRWDSKFGFMRFIDAKSDTIVLISSSSLIISTDGGNSWNERNNGVSISGVECLRIENENIYVGGKEGFYYSTDFGQSWRSPGTLVIGLHIKDIEIIKDTVYLATENGLYKAKDLFKGWEEVSFFKEKRVWQIHYGYDKLFARSFNRDYSQHSSYISTNNNFNNFSKLNFLENSTLYDFYIDYPNIYISSENIEYKVNLNSNYSTLFKKDTIYNLFGLSVFENNIVYTYIGTGPTSINKNFSYSKDYGETWNKTELIGVDNNFYIRDMFLLNNDTLLLTERNSGVYISINFQKEVILLKTDDEEINNLLSNVSKIFRRNNKIYFYGEGVILESDVNLRNWESYSNNIPPDSRILSFSKSNKIIYTVSVSGFNIMPSTVDFSVSKDEGNSWTKINSLFPNYENTVFNNVFAVEEYVFVSTSNGIFFSKDNGDSWVDLNNGLSILAKADGGEFHLYGDKILFCSRYGIFHRDLEELGITLTSVEKTEERNYLYTFPPFPQPTKQEVKINTYWDSALPFTVDDVEIYNLAGIKINTENKLSIDKESNYKGHIIWDTSSEQAGIYIVNIKHGTETRTQKIIVE